ncbi:MAG: hypothetical protein Q7K45_01065 [Nanoarchaeota archaeon]|nr:hypothetical protein [Nanoarchaeota archaeon]
MKLLFVYELGGVKEVEYLRQAGHEVDLVSTVNWAYEKLSQEKYAAVIIHGTDDMPVKDERHLCEVIRDEFPDIIRICYTGQITQDYRDRFMQRFDVISSKLFGVKGIEMILQVMKK